MMAAAVLNNTAVQQVRVAGRVTIVVTISTAVAVTVRGAVAVVAGSAVESSISAVRILRHGTGFGFWATCGVGLAP